MRSLQPIYKERIWGGDLLKRMFHLDTPHPVGEIWLASDHPAGQTVDERGNTLHDLFPQRSWFPVLIKILHAKTDLSVQVHPNDQQASALLDLGKTEGWLILHAEPGARICRGLTVDSRAALEERVAQGRLQDALRYETVVAGQYIPLPAGTVHALGAGIVALEVQQASDTTFRIYDYDRVDPSGKKRELHLAQALDVIDFASTMADRDLRRDQTSARWEAFFGNANAATAGIAREWLDQNPYFSLELLSVDGVSPFHVSREPGVVCVTALRGNVHPKGASPRSLPYPTWVLEAGEPLILEESGTVALVHLS